MRQKEKPMCQLSKERIWKRIRIGGYYYDSNNSVEHNSIDKTIEVLQKFKEEVKFGQYVDVVVMFDYDEGDENNLSHGYMSVYGLRLETDKEYSERLKLEIARMDNEKKSFEMRQAYYNTPAPDETLTGFEKRRKELSDTLKNL